jgi:Tfp pilus assembly protein PilZ
MADSERRRWRRLRTELSLQLHLIDEQDGGQTRTAVGSHMNPEGIFVQLADPPALGARVRVTLNAEGTDGVLSAEGRVVDRVVLDDTSARPPGVGIQLDHIGPGWKKLYDWLVEG